jgi:hypothetical protein
MNINFAWFHLPINRRRYFTGLLLFTLLFSGTFFSSFHRLSTGTGDFNEFLEDGTLAASTRRLGETLPAVYPPTARPLFMLMAAPPPKLALAMWWLIHAWMYWQCAVWLARWFHTGDQDAPVIRAACLIGIALAGIVSDLSVGQLTGLVLVCVIGSFEFDRRGRPFVGGALLAIPLLVKPLPVILLFYYLLRRRWAFLLGTATTWIVLGPLLLTLLFGWDNQIEGWRWFLDSTAQPRSPFNVFHRYADLPGRCFTFKNSGLAASLIRLFMDTTYDKYGHSVQIATIGPAALRAIWILLIAGPLAWVGWLTLRLRTRQATLHLFAALTGIMLLANPHFISYWLAVPMVTAAPLMGRLWIARQAQRRDWVCLAAILLWLAGSASVGVPVLRAAGSFPIAIAALTLVNLIIAGRPTAQPQ